MLAKLDWVALSIVINDCYGEQMKALIQDEWMSADGKVLRGTLKSGEKQAIIHVVSHESRIDVAQARQAGDKSSEITVMREFMKETGLDSSKISLDAHHCNPETMTQIEQAGGQYLIQVKENQPKLLEYCRDLGEQSSLAEKWIMIRLMDLFVLVKLIYTHLIYQILIVAGTKVVCER